MKTASCTAGWACGYKHKLNVHGKPIRQPRERLTLTWDSKWMLLSSLCYICVRNYVEPDFSLLTYQCLSSCVPTLLYIPALVHLYRSLIYTANIELIQKANTTEGFLIVNSHIQRTSLTLCTSVTHLTATTSSSSSWKKEPQSVRKETAMTAHCALSTGSVNI
jgi:hypothetical protein